MRWVAIGCLSLLAGCVVDPADYPGRPYAVSGEAVYGGDVGDTGAYAVPAYGGGYGYLSRGYRQPVYARPVFVPEVGPYPRGREDRERFERAERERPRQERPERVREAPQEHHFERHSERHPERGPEERGRRPWERP